MPSHAVSCKTCGKTFFVDQNRFVRTQHFFCSQPCYALWEREGFTGHNHSTFRRMMNLGFPSEFQKQIIFGTLLGDASLSKPRTGINYHLSVYHSLAQKEYCLEKFSLLKPFSSKIQYCDYLDKRNTKHYFGVRFHTFSHPFFTAIYPLFYQDGKKIAPLEISKLANEVALAFLIGDDGNIHRNTIYIATCSFTLDCVNRLLEWIKHFGVEAWITSADYLRIAISSKSLPVIQKLTQAYLPKTMHYKIGGVQHKESARRDLALPENRVQETTQFLCA